MKLYKSERTQDQMETRARYRDAIEKRPEFNAVHLAAVLMEAAPKERPYIVALDAGKLFGLAKQIAALALVDCNYGMTTRQERRREKLAAMVTEVASWYGLKAHCSGDPRGYVVRLSGPTIKPNGMGDGFGVA